MRLSMGLIIAGILVVLVGAACAPAAAPAPTAAPPKPTAAPAAPTAAPAAAKPTAAAAAQPAAAAKPAVSAVPSQELIDAAKKEGTVVVYTSNAAAPLTIAVEMFQKKYGIKVDYTRKGGPEIISLVDAERRAGKLKADVVGVGDDAQATSWANQGILAKYQPPAVAHQEPDALDPLGYYVTQYWNLMTILYNTQKVKDAELPKTYKELTDPKWKGRFSMSPSRGSGTGSVAVNILVNTYGWEYMQGLANNVPILISSVSAMPPVVINGEADLAFPMNEHIVTELIAKGEPIKMLYATDVMPLGKAVYAFTKDAPNPNAGKLFLDFLISDEYQVEMVKKSGARATNTTAPPPAGAPALKDLKTKRANTDYMINKIDEQHDKFDEIFRGMKAR